MLLANRVLLGDDIPLIYSPPICIRSRHIKGFSQFLKFEKDRILPAPEDVSQYGTTGMIDRMP